jgi:hypothetical protein
LIGPVDRLDFPDLGLYPDEFGQAPRRGVNEELVFARAHAEYKLARPFVEARYSLLHGAFDRIGVGTRLRKKHHEVEIAAEHFMPTFDGDSIFNVFAIEQSNDARVEYRFDGAIRANARAWLRRYDESAAYAGGVEAGVERVLRPDLRARVDALWDDGFGGRRAGAGIESAWRPVRRLWLRGRAIVLGVAPDDRTKYVTGAGVISSTYKLGDAAALHSIVEVDHDAIHDTQLRAIAVLDLSFTPEP